MLRAPIAVVLILVAGSLSSFMFVQGYYETFTHAVYVENVTATWCPTCRADQSLIAETYQKYQGSFYIVEFHVADEWDTEYGMLKAKEYDTTLVPTYAYDAGYAIKIGSFDKERLEETGRRAVHRTTLAIQKNIQERQLTFNGSVREEDSKTFNGGIEVVAVENGLQSKEITWNFVFRARLLKQDVSLSPNGYTIFFGTWSIPNNVNPKNVALIAVVFDTADRAGSRGPFAVQSVSDETSGAVISEFNMIGTVVGLAMVLTLSVFRTRRSHYRKAQRVRPLKI